MRTAPKKKIPPPEHTDNETNALPKDSRIFIIEESTTGIGMVRPKELFV